MPSGGAVDTRSDFDRWISEAYRAGDPAGFTALIVLVRIKRTDVRLQSSTYLHVVGDETSWAEMHALLKGAGVRWDGAVFFERRDVDGGPLEEPMARLYLTDLELRLAADRLVINEGEFFDVWGRRMRIDTVA